LKRAIITGAGGFVGANLARRLLQDGHDVHLLVRPSHRTWRLDEIASEVRLHEADVGDREGVRDILGGVKPDWVFHLAAYGAYPSQAGTERMMQTNLMGCVAMLDACAEIGVEAFVQTGSSSEYGYKDHPAVEDEALAPNSRYAVTKAAATHYAQLTALERNLHAVTLRLYSIYGPYEEPTRLIPTLIAFGLNGRLPPLVSPRTARDFVYVDEAVDAMVAVARRTTLPRGAVYNVCSGKQSSLESVVSAARGILGIRREPVWSSMQARSWDTDVWVGSPAALERATGWRTTVDLASGLEKTVAWFRENPQWLRHYARQISCPSR
jgi:dolichol-phosphate mannosyltransferase